MRPPLRRAALVLLLAAALAPGVLVRDPRRPPPDDQVVRFEPLAHPPRIPGSAATIAGAWRITARNTGFGGYSALLTRPDDRLLALSDAGWTLDFAPPRTRDPRPARIAPLPRAGAVLKRERDVEAATLDPAGGAIWTAFERANAIVRLAPDLRATAAIRPEAMRGWPNNRGPEAMVRLADGRFVVLAEARLDGSRHRGLVFAGDPTAGAPPQRFTYLPPTGFRPTDMAPLPDGRVLILNRRLVFPWRFASVLTVADPAEIAPGRTWRGRVVARLTPPLPIDNFEGMALAPRPDGALTIWLISDDNAAARVQRTVLLELRWKPGPRRPR